MCRDVNGHGTHVSSTAAGNYGVQAPYTPAGALLSGTAPRARLAVYKVGCTGAALTSQTAAASALFP